MVSPAFASWNLIKNWLTGLKALRGVTAQQEAGCESSQPAIATELHVASA